MVRVCLVLLIIGIDIIGLIKIKLLINKVNKKYNNAIEFLNTLREFYNKLFNEKTFDYKLYECIKLKTAKMQNEMGNWGIIETIQLPNSNFIHYNYPLIVNGFTEVRNMYINFGGVADNFSRTQMAFVLGAIDDILLTYIGALEEEKNVLVRKIKNPFILFEQGIRSILYLPSTLALWTGFVSEDSYDKRFESWFLKLISFIISVLGFLSSIITIIGFKPLEKYIKTFINF